MELRWEKTLLLSLFSPSTKSKDYCGFSDSGKLKSTMFKNFSSLTWQPRIVKGSAGSSQKHILIWKRASQRNFFQDTSWAMNSCLAFSQKIFTFFTIITHFIYYSFKKQTNKQKPTTKQKQNQNYKTILFCFTLVLPVLSARETSLNVFFLVQDKGIFLFFFFFCNEVYWQKKIMERDEHTSLSVLLL